ncbi:MAG: carotenoid oxygenase family protein [Myxococcales bacterium]|nr:carotenoid oxygenase family protein [Myxococcales bacterium]
MDATTGSSPAAAPDFSALWASVGRTHDWTPLRVEGELPSRLRATIVRTGPGLMERFGRRHRHSFEADGVMVGLRLRGDGGAEGAVRVVEGPEYRVEQAAGRPLYGSIAPWWRRFANSLRRRTKATGNTAMMAWQGRLYALMEGARPLEIDPATLATLGLRDLGGVLGATFCAHPHRVEARRTTFGFGVEYGPKPALRLHALPDQGPARTLGTVPLPWNTMVHDFAVTPRHAVFVICPLRLSLWRAILALDGMDGLFHWTPSDGAELLVVPLDAVDAPLRLPLAPRFVFHLANAYEHGSTLVIDWVQYPNADVMSALSGDDAAPRVAPSRLERVTVDLAARTVVGDEVRWDHGCEFPVVPPALVGQRTEALWLLASGEGQARGLARLDPESGRVNAWAPDPALRASEALLLPAPAATRPYQGWLASLVLDTGRGESFFGIFDADRPSAGPVARVWMGQALPTTFHGTVLP